jgi:hypothetical protein
MLKWNLRSCLVHHVALLTGCICQYGHVDMLSQVSTRSSRQTGQSERRPESVAHTCGGCSVSEPTRNLPGWTDISRHVWLLLTTRVHPHFYQSTFVNDFLLLTSESAYCTRCGRLQNVRIRWWIGRFVADVCLKFIKTIKWWMGVYITIINYLYPGNVPSERKSGALPLC